MKRLALSAVSLLALLTGAQVQSGALSALSFHVTSIGQVPHGSMSGYVTGEVVALQCNGLEFSTPPSIQIAATGGVPTAATIVNRGSTSRGIPPQNVECSQRSTTGKGSGLIVSARLGAFIDFTAILVGSPAPTMHVANNAALVLYVDSYGGVVWRDGYAAAGDGGAASYYHSNSACALNAGAGDGGSQIPAADGKCWPLAPGGEAVDVGVFGVDMTGSSPASGQTTALQNAFNYGGRLVVRPGTVNINGPVACNVQGTTLAGSGFNTNIVQNNVTADVFQLNTSGCVLEDFRISGSQTAGVMINENGSAYTSLQRLYLYGWFTGVNIGGVSAVGQHARDVFMFSPSNTGSTGFVVNPTGRGSIDTVVENVLISGAGGSAFLVKNTGDTLLKHVSTIGMTNGLAVEPGAGQVVQLLDVSDSLFDTSASNGLLFNPSGSGVVQQAKVHNSWVATSASVGVVAATTAGGATLQLEFVDDVIANNTSHGFLNKDSGTTNIRFVGGSISANGGYGAFFNTGTTKFSLDGTRVGPTGQFAVGNLGGGIALAGSNDNFNIHDLDASGNSGSNLFLGFYSGTHGSINNVVGYNPVGVTSAAYATATMATYAAGPTSEDHYLTGGTVTAVKVPTNAGSTICSTTPCALRLGPNETFSVTYTVAPTDVKSIH